MTNNNQIALISKYLPLLDQKYQVESKSAILDVDPSFVRETTEAKSILLPKMTLSGLADYDRNGGYVGGDQKIEWQTHTFTQDRNRMFTVDTMDDAETAFVAFSMLAGEFIRLHVAPELDAYRFSRYATLAGTKEPAAAALTETTILPALVKGRTALSNKQVPLNDIIIFMTPDTMGALMLNDKVAKSLSVDKLTLHNIELEVMTFNRMPIIEVPAERMKTAYTLRDGTTASQTQGGFTPAAGARQINFLMMARSSVLQVVKRAMPKIIAPDVNQGADGWRFGYRIYHDTFVPDNRADGIYVHSSPNA